MAAEIYSHSRLSSFEDCPKKFEFRYKLKIPSETESIEGFVGKRVHEVLERLYGFVGKGMVPSLGKVLERYRAFWEEHYDATRVRIVRTENDVDHYRALGEHCLTNYYRRFYPFDADETIALEERVLFSLDSAKQYRIQGFVDRIVRAQDDVIEIHDYKTSARVPSQSKLDSDRQLALYQMGLADRFGVDRPMRLVWHYLAPNQTRVSTRNAEQLQALREQTMGLIDRIRVASEFEPKIGPLCKWCEFADICPAQAELRETRGEPPHPVDHPDPPPRRRQLPLL